MATVEWPECHGRTHVAQWAGLVVVVLVAAAASREMRVAGGLL